MLNKLRLHGNIWLAADIHLGPTSPKTAHAFYQFLKQAKNEAQALILCGDIFNAWIGADLAIDPPPWLAHAVYHFRNTALELPIFFMRGNRDFLLNARFAHYVGAQMLDDQIILQTDHHNVLLTHGDELCTDDKSYQAFRRKVRNPKIQKLFLALPLHWRQRIAGGMRKKSAAKHVKMSPQISDVSEESCIQLLRQHHKNVLIHGHTHRPALHRMQTKEGENLSRIVLPDWEFDHTKPTRAGWLVLQANGLIALHRHHQPTIRFKLKPQAPQYAESYYLKTHSQNN